MSRVALTHLALRVADVDRSIDFYRRYADLAVAHEREDHGTRVAWLAEAAAADDPQFVIVLMGMEAKPSPAPRPVDHLGFAVASREEVDRLGRMGKEERILVLAPVDAGPIVGYICEVADPDGNVCEFSFGQPIHPRDPSPRG